ncbi:MAG: hypothetical protein AAFV29_01460, partial [Myxococcota bacterium]
CADSTARRRHVSWMQTLGMFATTLRSGFVPTVLSRSSWMPMVVTPFVVSLIFAGAPNVAKSQEYRREVLSPVYRVDKKYRSMMGPQSSTEVQLSDAQGQELLWITGYEATMVGADGRSPQAQEFMCHSNLDLDPVRHRRAMSAERGISGRLFTLSQGQFQIQFPEGFGIPILSSEALTLTTQVLNLNHDPANFDVRHRVQIKYRRQSELAQPMGPLFQKSVYGLALLEGKDGHYGHDPGTMNGQGCLEKDNASDHEYKDPYGRRFTGHWVVKPGREVNRTPVTKLLSLPYDARVHYIAVHLHPFAQSLTLIDKTTKKTVFASRAENFEKKIGLKRVDYFSSKEGILMPKDHEYELISVYENTTAEPQDSMAVMYMYFADPVFKAP